MLQRRDSDEATTAKKQRVVWSVEMHQQFVAAVNQLGIDSEMPTTWLGTVHHRVNHGRIVSCHKHCAVACLVLRGVDRKLIFCSDMQRLCQSGFWTS